VPARASLDLRRGAYSAPVSGEFGPRPSSAFAAGRLTFGRFLFFLRAPFLLQALLTERPPRPALG